MPVSFSELQLAFEFVSSGGMGENEAYLDRQSGKIYWHSEFGDNDEELPDDTDDQKYISIPDKRELDLGKPLALDFAREFLPDDYDEVRYIFSRRGAYRRYKELLERRDALERRYDFSNKAEAATLREWCAVNRLATAIDAARLAPALRPIGEAREVAAHLIGRSANRALEPTGVVLRGTESLLTHRWRKRNSNPRSPRKEHFFETGPEPGDDKLAGRLSPDSDVKCHETSLENDRR
jgi:hypothetical protein